MAMIKNKAMARAFGALAPDDGQRLPVNLAATNRVDAAD